MEISQKTRQVYSEVDEFIGLLKIEQINKIPENLREIFKTEKDKNYTKGINPNKTIESQNLKEETLAIIAYLNLEYLCEDENEKERLERVYQKNENEYQKKLSEKYKIDDIFEKHEDFDENANIKEIIPYNESIIRKIINKILSIFHLK